MGGEQDERDAVLEPDHEGGGGRGAVLGARARMPAIQNRRARSDCAAEVVKK